MAFNEAYNMFKFNFMPNILRNHFLVLKVISKFSKRECTFKRDDNVFLVEFIKPPIGFRSLDNRFNARCFVNVSLDDFSFSLDNDELIIFLNKDNPLDYKLESFTPYVKLGNMLLNEKDYYYKKIKKNLIEVVRDIKHSEELYAQIAKFSSISKRLIENSNECNSRVSQYDSVKSSKHDDDKRDNSNPSYRDFIDN